MSGLRLFSGVMGLVLGALILLYLFNRQSIQDFKPALSGFYAKSFCSCYFVSERSEADCHEYSRQYLPIQTFDLDSEKQAVTVVALFRESRAVYRGKREGCQLDGLSEGSKPEDNLGQ